ncbi:hypothetical protein [Paenibacillus guangzhouensis]|uniref:hypothetical protein n=1 Tax=Paenibacillus guangzhouensis TaxID=1473112 RepID=UPI0012670E45|nr:hypothetical protein [Paenibacillus guangzhouensis]
MPNKYVFDKITHPIYDVLLNTYASPGIIGPPESDASKSGALFASSAQNSGTLSVLGGSVNITLQVANNSANTTMYVSSITGGIGVALNLLSSFTGSFTLSSGGTLTTPTTLTPVNTNFASSNTSSMTARSSTAAPTGATTVLTSPITNNFQFMVNFTGGIIVPPTRSITLNVIGTLSVAGTVTSAANIIWWEI